MAISREKYLEIYKHRKETGYYKKEIERLKNLVYKKLGDKCVICGFSDKRALQIDHVNNDGYLEYKNVDNKTAPNRRGNTPNRLRRVLKDKENRYQILCANCNWIKRAEFKELNK